MAAGTIDLIIDKGSTFRKVFKYQNSNREPIDLTGYTARMQVRKTFSSPGYILNLSTPSNIIITPLEGKIEIYIHDSVTSNIQESAGVYDLELIAPSGDVSKFIRGSVRFPEEVTK